MMLRLYKNERGFTLIELLVVLAIIAILAAVAIPALMSYTQRARETRVLGELASFKTVVEAWAVDEGKGYYPNDDDSNNDKVDKDIVGVMEKAEIEWPPEDPWGKDYTYEVTDDNRDFIIYTINEPDDLVLYVTNKADPTKGEGADDWEGLAPGPDPDDEGGDEEEQNGEQG